MFIQKFFRKVEKEKKVLKPERGNEVAEYAVPIMVFVVFSFFVSGYSQLSERLRAYYNPRVETALTQQESEGGQALQQKDRLQVMPNKDNTALGTLRILTVRGHEYVLANYPLKPVSLASADGAAAVTGRFLDALEFLISELALKQELKAEQLKAFRHLLEQGRRVQYIEEQVEVAAQLGVSSEVFRAHRVKLDDRNFTMAQLTSLIGYRNNVYELQLKSPFSEALNPREETKALIDAYIEVKKSGALKDLVLERFLRSLVIHVLYLSEAVEATSDYIIYNDNLDPTIYSSILLKQISLYDYCLNGEGKEDQHFYCAK